MIGAVIADATAGLVVMKWFRAKKQQANLNRWKDTRHSFPIIDQVLKQAAGKPTAKQIKWADRFTKSIVHIASSEAFHWLVLGLMNKESRTGRDARSFVSTMKGKDQRAKIL